MSSIRSDFHTSVISQFIDDIYYQRSNYFHFLGKTDQWNTNDVPSSSSPDDNASQDISVRDSMVYLKKVTPSDASLVTACHQWVSEAVYAQWDHTQTMKTQSFYCITEDYNVYKCLDNVSGSKSTVKPPALSDVDDFTVPVRTSDGYLWKYMYTVPSFKRQKFLTADYLPVQRALSDAFYNKGSVINVTVLNSGQNYTSDTIITVTGDGQDAEFSPVIQGGHIVDVIVDNPGFGYSYVTLGLNGTAGSGASLKVILASSDLSSNQSVVEQTVVKGAIYSAAITTPGTGYTTGATATVTGDGTGATAEIELGDGGSIKHIKMTNYGQNYTTAAITINDVNRTGVVTDAVVYAILPPLNGHGFDAVKELYADTVSISTSIRGDSDLISLGQDFRQYGIIQNPTNLLDNTYITNHLNFTTFRVELDNVSGISKDNVLVSDHVKYQVVNVYTQQKQVDLIQMCYIYKNLGSTLTKGNTSYTVNQVLSTPSVNKYSGNLMYVANKDPFAPSAEQSIAIRTNIKL